MSTRDAILSRIHQPRGVGDVTKVLAARRLGPQPKPSADRIVYFTERARALASSVALVDSRAAIAAEVARYLDEQQLDKSLVCWPELHALEWQAAGIAAESRQAKPSDLVGVTGAFAAIAETGTLVMASGEHTPPAVSLLPETHIAVLPASRIVDTMEDAFSLLREERREWPRAVNLISGPSRTADIEQTVTLGAHGPYRVHIIIVGA